MALCIEAGGRLNEQFLKLIDYFASVNGSTEAERRAFTIFALQRVHLASQRGVAQLIRTQEPIPDGPCFLPPRGSIFAYSKSSQVSNPHKSKSSQSSSSKNFTCACGVLWCCSSGFSASGWADIPGTYTYHSTLILSLTFFVCDHLFEETCAPRKLVLNRRNELSNILFYRRFASPRTPQ